MAIEIIIPITAKTEEGFKKAIDKIKELGSLMLRHAKFAYHDNVYGVSITLDAQLLPNAVFIPENPTCFEQKDNEATFTYKGYQLIYINLNKFSGLFKFNNEYIGKNN